MRAVCLALALCVSYAAAAVTAPELEGSELEVDFTSALDERKYVVKQVDNEVKYTTVPFKVTGIKAGETVYHGCFHGDTPVVGSEKPLTEDVTTAAAQTCTVTEEQAAGTGDITYQVYTKDGSGKKTVIATSKASLLTVLDLKSTKPEKWVIAREGCSVKFDILGLYSNPPLRSVCGFYQGQDWVEETLVDSADEKTVWTAVALSEDGPDSDFYAWRLDKESLEVGATDKTKEVHAGCKFYVDGQEYAEFELTQMIAFTENEKKCEANPLVAFGESYEGDNEIAVTSFGTTEENCWTGETYSTSQITCDNSKAFTVFCQDGTYMYTDSSVDKPAKYDSNTTALAFADETCGTAAILPVSLLVGALALLASRA